MVGESYLLCCNRIDLLKGIPVLRWMREIGGEMLVSVYAMTDLDCISIFKAF